MTRPADVLVVGAGPAGSSLALRLARAGVRVAVLDAREFPRSKPCGDAISPGATPLLEELAVVDAIEAAGAARIGAWRLRAPNGRWFEGSFEADSAAPPFGYGLPRSRLDALLLAAATAAGATLLPRRRVFELLRGAAGRAAPRTTGVVARGPDGEVERHEARLVAGADGLRSRVARRLGGVRLGRRRRLALVGRFRASGLGRGFSGRGEMRISADGVLGAAPTGPDDCTVALVVDEARARELSGDPWRFYRRGLSRHGVRERLAGARRLGELEITGPFEVSPRRAAGPGVLLVGDAAGYFDPFTGQGIYRALLLAREAAATILAILERPEREEDRLADYARRTRRILAPSRRVQRLVDAFVAHPPLMNPAATLLAERPGLASLLVDVTGDRIPAAALADPRRLLSALRAGPFWPPAADAAPTARPPSADDQPELSATSRSRHAHA